MLKLDLGAGTVSPPGFTPLGRRHNSEIFPLPYADGSVDEIRASHVLEHFSHRQIGTVLADWVRVLKPGGRLRVAVPDFLLIAQGYVAGEPLNVQGYIMGGHAAADDHHGTIFDEESLREALEAAGLGQIERWSSELADCADLPISLNLGGVKMAPRTSVKVAAAMSVPRLGFMDNFFCAIEALPPLGITIHRNSGAYWGQCLERCFEQIIEEGADWVLTLDYDTVFNRTHVEQLLRLALANPAVDAVAPIQASRHRGTPLFTIKGADGANTGQVPWETFEPDLVPIATAHFGLTLLRVSALKKLRKPWFIGQPDASGGWGDGRIDDDVRFWHLWAKHGNSLFLAPRVSVGHMELMVRWPGPDLQALYQPVAEYRESAAPKEIWK